MPSIEDVAFCDAFVKSASIVWTLGDWLRFYKVSTTLRRIALRVFLQDVQWRCRMGLPPSVVPVSNKRIDFVGDVHVAVRFHEASKILQNNSVSHLRHSVMLSLQEFAADGKHVTEQQLKEWGMTSVDERKQLISVLTRERCDECGCTQLATTTNAHVHKVYVWKSMADPSVTDAREIQATKHLRHLCDRCTHDTAGYRCVVNPQQVEAMLSAVLPVGHWGKGQMRRIRRFSRMISLTNSYWFKGKHRLRWRRQIMAMLDAVSHRMDHERRRREELLTQRAKVDDQIMSPLCLCSVCMDKPREVVSLPCKHVSMCRECAQKCLACPHCRVPLAHIVEYTTDIFPDEKLYCP